MRVIDTIGITIDCLPGTEEAVADFWEAALGYRKLLPFMLVDPAGVKPRLIFQEVPEPKEVKNRWHLDLYVENLEALEPEVQRMEALGATVVHHLDEPTMGYTNTFTMMLDPHGNEFCICAPHVPIA